MFTSVGGAVWIYIANLHEVYASDACLPNIQWLRGVSCARESLRALLISAHRCVVRTHRWAEVAGD
jgi:hypothetical protein